MVGQVLTAEDILQTQDGNNSKYKSVEVFKEVEPKIDAGNLLLDDLQPIDIKELRSDSEKFLNILARNNAQLLFQKIWQLPIERFDNVIIAKLPIPVTILPREKKIPKAKPPTKWEIFAKRKGISNKKRGRMIWDEESKSWKPRFGYKRGNDDTKEWCMEVPVNSDPNELQFEKKDNEKKERTAKNEFQRLRNIKRNTTGNNTIKLQPDAKKEKDKEIDMAKLSTASLGKFQEKLPKEKDNKKQNKKRKFESVTGNSSSEKQKALELWNKINKQPKLDVTKGVNKHIDNEQMNASSQKKKSGKVKNKRYRKGAQSVTDKKKQSKTFGKGRTLGKGKQRK